MSPDKKEIINGKKVEEYYWAGKKVVYIDNRIVASNFEDTCEAIRQGMERPFADCEYIHPEDGCCMNDNNVSPECHNYVCPRV